jgi:hypothetical protein
MIKDPIFENERITSGSDHHMKELATTFVESVASYKNPLFIDLLGTLLTNSLSTRYDDDFSSYRLPHGSTITSSFGVNPSSFGLPE